MSPHSNIRSSVGKTDLGGQISVMNRLNAVVFVRLDVMQIDFHWEIEKYLTFRGREFSLVWKRVGDHS